MDDSFKFFVDQVVGQYKDLKADIKADLLELKESMQDHRSEHERLKQRVSELERFRSYMAGAAAFAFVLAEIIGKSIEYYFKK